jgi:cation diffusion facilitator CzcD-associated flavoprotein CzcO/acetyl esterase/lipase
MSPPLKASWQARVAAFIVRHRVKPVLRDMSDIMRVRRAFGQPLPIPRGAAFTDDTVGGVPGEWAQAEQGDAPDITLLYLHGGGFVGCSPRTHRPLTASLALRGLRVFVPDYRLAPEHPFPAAPNDVLAVWRALRASHPGRMVVAGDSAGGNLALGLLLTLRDAGEPLPDAAVLFSPATDLTGGGPSILENTERDAMFVGEQLQHLVDAYLAGADAQQPLASPLLGELHGLPPLMFQVGESEVLRDDSVRFAHKARAAGVAVKLDIYLVVPHVWQLMWRVPEAKRGLDDAARFMRESVHQDAHADVHEGAQEAMPVVAPAAAAVAADVPRPVEQFDVVIVGAGLSGIGAAVHLQRECPGKRFALLEARGAIGGTWDLFRYPGVRSDSDMYTLGYDFKPWNDAKAIAEGPAIRGYIAEAARENGIERHIRLQQRVLSADWSSREACWTLVIDHGEGRERSALRANFVLLCSGYYSYMCGYRPPFQGEERYRGTLVHPQFWPEKLDCAGKRVVVVGSGATAVTLVPALAGKAAHVTMLQRSPSYVVARPAQDTIAAFLKRWLPAKVAYRLVRVKNVAINMHYYRLARKYPKQAKARLVGFVQQALGPGFDVARHFTPHYNPWDQRVCLVPDGDLFKAIRSGRASVATDQIDTFTERGIRLRSGEELEADVIITATGLQLNVLGDIKLSLEGVPCDLSQMLVYKGTMYSGIPNLANTFGYTNASWTLKADLTSRYVCRLLNYMDRHDIAVATPVRGPGVASEPLLDFTSGYVLRAVEQLPKQGDRKPWRLYQNYLLDQLVLRLGRVDDGVMAFGRRP